MRYVYIALIVLLTAIVLICKFQNLSSVTISLLGMSATLPLSTLVILVYLLGMVTGECPIWPGAELDSTSHAAATLIGAVSLLFAWYSITSYSWWSI